MFLGVSSLISNYLLLNKLIYKCINVVQKNKMCIASPLAISKFKRAGTSLLFSGRDHLYC